MGLQDATGRKKPSNVRLFLCATLLVKVELKFNFWTHSPEIMAAPLLVPLPPHPAMRATVWNRNDTYDAQTVFVIHNFELADYAPDESVTSRVTERLCKVMARFHDRDDLSRQVSGTARELVEDRKKNFGLRRAVLPFVGLMHSELGLDVAVVMWSHAKRGTSLKSVPSIRGPHDYQVERALGGIAAHLCDVWYPYLCLEWGADLYGHVFQSLKARKEWECVDEARDRGWLHRVSMYGRLTVGSNYVFRSPVVERKGPYSIIYVINDMLSPENKKKADKRCVGVRNLRITTKWCDDAAARRELRGRMLRKRDEYHAFLVKHSIPFGSLAAVASLGRLCTGRVAQACGGRKRVCGGEPEYGTHAGLVLNKFMACCNGGRFRNALATHITDIVASFLCNRNVGVTGLEGVSDYGGIMQTWREAMGSREMPLENHGIQEQNVRLDTLTFAINHLRFIPEYSGIVTGTVSTGKFHFKSLPDLDDISYTLASTADAPNRIVTLVLYVSGDRARSFLGDATL